MLSYYFSPDFSQSELSREIKDFLLDHDISTWEEGVQSKRLIFIREDHQVLEDFNKEVDLVFKYPAANVGLFESMSDIVFFEISNNLDEIFYIIESELELSRFSSEAALLKEFDSKDVKATFNTTPAIIEDNLVDAIDKFFEERTLDLIPLSLNSLSPNELALEYIQALLRQFIKELNHYQKHSQILNQSLDQIEHGLLLRDNSGEVLWFNEAFKQFNLNPTDVAFKNTKFESEDFDWEVEVINLNPNTKLSIIYKLEHDKSMQSNEELGIISSSIAHELNNPLGGISAALDVLMLDDHEDEMMDSFKKMKETIYRCKGLVQTFLGFSRKNIEETQSLNWEAAVGQAYELLKFRMVESNLKLNYNFMREKEFKISANSSVLTMVFYLILNDLLTMTSHSDLVRLSDTKQFEVIVKEKKDCISINTSSDISKLQLPQHKLLNHLLQLFNLELNVGPKALTIQLN